MAILTECLQRVFRSQTLQLLTACMMPAQPCLQYRTGSNNQNRPVMARTAAEQAIIEISIRKGDHLEKSKKGLVSEHSVGNQSAPYRRLSAPPGTKCRKSHENASRGLRPGTPKRLQKVSGQSGKSPGISGPEGPRDPCKGFSGSQEKRLMRLNF